MTKKSFKKRVKVLLQLSETECGVTALAMLLAHYGLTIPIEILREKCGTSKDGSKATTLLTVSRELGFQADGYKVELKDIIALGEPVIAFWNFNHYVVICGADQHKVWINDPGQGKLVVSLEEFDKAFTGIVIAIKPLTKYISNKTSSSVLPYLKEWLWQFKTEWLCIVIISLFYMCGPLLNSFISSVFINYCVIISNNYWLPWLALFAVGIATFMMVTTVIQQSNQFKISAKASLLKTSNLIIHALRLPLLYYSIRQKSEIIAVLARAETVLDSLFKNLTSFVVSLFMSVICLIAMLKIDSGLTAIIIVSAIIFTLIVWAMSKINLSYEKKHINTESKLYAFAMASLRNLETIKACALEHDMMAKWYGFFCKNVQAKQNIAVLSAKINTVQQLANSLSLLIMLYWASIRVAQGALSIGGLIAYYTLQSIFFKNMEAFMLAHKAGQQAFAAHLRINDLKNYAEDKRFQLSSSTDSFKPTQPLLTCANLNFYYNKHADKVLNQINLEILAGQHIALVGATGSGKSSLAKLLCGLYPFEEGDILLFGNSIKTFSNTDFNQNFSYVSQDVGLFSGTLYENLVLDRINIPLQKINDAIYNASLKELIALRGLNARVEENGRNFSGGEKQRLEIARALLHDAPILILDEATSALDVTTEAKIIANLRALNKTIIYVAHRLSIVHHCDQIYVLDHGRIVEQGSHDQLLKNKQHYFKLKNDSHEC